MRRAIAVLAVVVVFALDHFAEHVDPRAASACRVALLCVLLGAIRYDNNPARRRRLVCPVKRRCRLYDLARNARACSGLLAICKGKRAEKYLWRTAAERLRPSTEYLAKKARVIARCVFGHSPRWPAEGSKGPAEEQTGDRRGGAAGRDARGRLGVRGEGGLGSTGVGAPTNAETPPQSGGAGPGAPSVSKSPAWGEDLAGADEHEAADEEDPGSQSRNVGGGADWTMWRQPFLSKLMAEAKDDPVPDEAKNDVGESMRAEMEQHRERVRCAFGFCGREDWRAPVADVAMLLFDKTSDEFKNELLVTRLFVLLFHRRYRAHFGDIVYEYRNGSWVRAHSISYPALDYITRNLRLAESAFGIMARAEVVPARAFVTVAREVQRILDTRNQVMLCEELLKSRGAKSSTWPADAAKLCQGMFKCYTDPGREKTVLSNFVKWCSGPTPGAQRGVNFSNRYYDIRPGVARTDRMIVERRPQSPENDSYTYVPIEIHFQLPDDAVRRMDQFFCTTFAGTSGALEM